ncbi:hypothetical protein EVAR_19529_1 [Eumeta japonica]|uniref:Uncharacterized protein n=1 Tax=Eumeta variegata TaxID=151549 RepID=A0A4C1UFD1_EUMVA|nr:hypothetical protein EVAR_19529_1 [Eumeta japonica]
MPHSPHVPRSTGPAPAAPPEAGGRGRCLVSDYRPPPARRVPAHRRERSRLIKVEGRHLESRNFGAKFLSNLLPDGATSTNVRSFRAPECEHAIELKLVYLSARPLKEHILAKKLPRFFKMSLLKRRTDDLSFLSLYPMSSYRSRNSLRHKRRSYDWVEFSLKKIINEQRWRRPPPMMRKVLVRGGDAPKFCTRITLSTLCGRFTPPSIATMKI